MKRIKIILAAALAVSLVLSCMGPAVWAAPPAVSTDEAVYVNLDYYGIPSGVSVVKSCSLNGNTEFWDYGSYVTVSNMTDHTVPELNDEGVHWRLPGNISRFYYECKPKTNQIILPWDINVDYKLNGVPAAATQLAGAEGMVEMTVHCKPNSAAQPYYRHNMLLQCATMINMQDTLSVEAPGAQLQSMGTYKVVIFAALPGEETSFTLRIGTNSFETSGLMFMMIPGTLSQMEQIKRLKEAKDTMENAVDDVYGSLNEILDMIAGMEAGIEQTKAGVEQLNQARDAFSSQKDGVYQSADDAISDLNAFSDELLQLVPYMKDGQKLIADVNQDVNQLIKSLNQVKPQITRIQNQVTKLQKDSAAFQKVLRDLNSTSAQRKEVEKAMRSDLEAMKSTVSELKKNASAIAEDLSSVTQTLNQLANSFKYLDKAYMPSSVSKFLNAMEKIFPDLADAARYDLQGLINSANRTIRDVNKIIENTQYSLRVIANLMSSINDTSETVLKFCDDAQTLTDTLNQALDLADTCFSVLNTGEQATQDLLKDLDQTGTYLNQTLDIGKKLIGDAAQLNTTVNGYQKNATAFLEEGETLTESLNNAVTSTTGFLSTFEGFLKANGAALDTSATTTLDGILTLLNDGLKQLPVTGNLKSTNKTIKETADSQISKYEDDNQLLYLDADAKLISFTSPQNPEPESIQIILRTEEISLDAKSADNSDLEAGAEKIGFWARAGKIFQKIWTSVISIFTK